MRLGLNCAVLLRGTSGSARAVHHLRDGFRSLDGISTRDLAPGYRLRPSRLWNLAAQAAWDLRGAAHAAADCDVLVSPTNVGRARRGQRHLLVLHDTMVLDRPDLFDRGYSAYARLLFDVSVRHADALIVPSSYTAGRIRDRWPTAVPITVAPWPVTVSAHAPRAGIPEAPPTVIVVGVTEPHKRQEVAVEAVRLARIMSGVDIRLRLIGPAGRAETTLRRVLITADPGGEWIRREADVTDAALRDAYRRSWLLLQPSTFEGYGLPVAEAAGFALPALHSGEGALPEIVPQRRLGADPAAYADAMCELLDAATYRAVSREALTAAGRKSRQQFAGRLREAVHPQ